MGFIPPRPPMALPRFVDVMIRRIRSRNPNIQNVPRTTPSTTSTTSTFYPTPLEERESAIRQTCEAARNLSFSTRDAVQAVRALGQAGVRAGNMSEYNMGFVNRVVITSSEGRDITIENPSVLIRINREVITHYSNAVADRSVVTNEEKLVEVDVDEQTFFDTIRLIRED